MFAFQWGYDSVLEHSGISSYSITHYKRLCIRTTVCPTLATDLSHVQMF